MQFTTDNAWNKPDDAVWSSHRTRNDFPMLLTVAEAAALLRTTRRAIYAMIERRQVPGVIASVDACCFARTTGYTGSTRSARHRRRSKRR